MRKITMMTLMAMLVLPGVASARWHVLPKVNLKIDIPKAWQVASEGDVLTAMPASQDVALMIWEAGKATNIEQAAGALDAELGKYIKNAKEKGEPQVVEINGLQAVFQDGTGTAEGKRIEWSVGLIENGRGKILLILGMAEPAAVKKYEKRLQRILTSVQRS
jgi:hypothetical protein